MKQEELTKSLLHQLDRMSAALPSLVKTDTSYRSEEGKWSKKEELGHLIDSALNNLKRFTEISFSPSPMQIVQYNQNGLVAANAYNEEELLILVELWVRLNQRILAVWIAQGSELDAHQLVMPDGTQNDYRFLKEDYVEHMKHHLDTILTLASVK